MTWECEYSTADLIERMGVSSSSDILICRQRMIELSAENARQCAEIAILKKITLLTDSQIKALLDAVVDIAEAVR